MSGERPTRLWSWNALALALLVAYVAGIILFGYAALTTTPAPTAYALRPPLAGYGDPRAWWPIALQLALGLAAFGAYYVPRRHQTRSFSLLVTGGLGVTTILLGVLGGWNCAAPESPFFAPLAIALGLLFGATPTFTGACAGQPFPPALQLARLLGPLLLVITALGVAASLFRTQLDRLVVRFARALVVVVGLGDEALPLVRRLAAERQRGSVLAVLVPDADDPLVRLTRQLGARVVAADPADRDALSVLVGRHDRFKVRALHLVSADAAANLAGAEQFRAVADVGGTGRGDPPPRLAVRIDDPWPAEYWRRTNAYRTPPDGSPRAVRWVSDAVSSYEVTAAILVDAVQAAAHDRLVVVGGSSLALALCAELAQRQREGNVLGRRRRPSLTELVLVGPTAAELRRQHQLRQERFGNAAAGAVVVSPVVPTESGLVELLAGSAAPVVIFADDPARVRTRDADPGPALLAASHPDWTIYAADPAVQGLAPRPIMERLFAFGLTIEPPVGFAVDSWERAARVVHEAYLSGLGDQREPARPTHGPWPALPPFYRASNVRLVTATLAGAEATGRTWGPTDGRPGASTAVPPDQLEVMARLEHESWRRFHLEQGWRYGPVRDDARRRHDALQPWDALSPDYRARAAGVVRAALATLAALGYRSSATNLRRPWIAANRCGEVRATVLDQDWRWQTGSGEWLQARAGDYRVSNGSGPAWSVDPAIFAQTHTHVAGDRWRRTGQVLAQPAVPGELVISLEGAQTATEGDWVIRGAAGEQWLTSAGHFAENYERVDA